MSSPRRLLAGLASAFMAVAGLTLITPSDAQAQSAARVESQTLFSALEKNRITASLRTARDGGKWLRFSPHFYNTRAEMDTVIKILGEEIA